MMGVFVHTGTLEPSPIFRGIQFLSSVVRMEAFFIISGFMAYLMLQKYGALVTVKKRFITIGIPFIVTLVLLNPVTNYLIYVHHNAPISFASYLLDGGQENAAGPLVWHLHLWFLVSLLVYGIITPSVPYIIDISAKISLFTKVNLGSNLIFAIICVAVPIACLSSRVVYEYLFERLFVDTGFSFIVRSTLYYFPFFFLGMTLYKFPRLLKTFSNFHPIHLIFSVGILSLSILYFDDLPKLVAETIRLLSKAYIAVSLSSTLFFVFHLFLSKRNPIFRYLSDASYSVYIFHFITIYVIADIFGFVFGEGQLYLFFVVVLTFIVTLLIHHFIIQRIEILRLMFNGKFSIRKSN